MSFEGWSAADVPDQSGRTVVITGATSGIGFEAAKVLAARGAETVLAVRNPAKGAQAVDEIRRTSAGAWVESMPLDLADLSSVRDFAVEFVDRFPTLDVLVNNAGIMMVPYATTVDGFERQFGTNHLGHFALTGLLLEPLRAAPAARVVTVSSNAHRSGDMEFGNLQYDGGRDYTAIGAYSRSKLANLLFAYELDRRLRRHHESIVSVAAHPGATNTNLAVHLEKTWWGRIAFPIARRFLQNAADGALPLLRAAADPDVRGGEYYGPVARRETTGPPELVTSNQLSHDEEVAARLWDVSQELTRVSYL